MYNFATNEPDDMVSKANIAMIEPSETKEKATQIDHSKAFSNIKLKSKPKNNYVSKFYSSLGDFHTFSNFKGGFIAARVVNL